MNRALVSVSDKTGLVPFVKALSERGIEIISTGGTASALRAAGIPVCSVEDITGFPEIMGGRVKTLHPKIHGGLLGVRDDATHQKQMRDHAIVPIDLVCINLYPFEQTIAKPGVSHEDAIENIDIGGPAMIRSASKNHESVAVVTAASQYERVLREIAERQGCTSLALRHELAAEAFARTARYDAAIACYFTKQPAGAFPPLLTQTLVKADDLRYGENPHQRAALYRAFTPGGHAPTGTVAGAEQLHGKELSYNNILDATAALDLAWSLLRVSPSRVGASVVKHTNPCGCAIADSAKDAVAEAIAGDPVAAYGGILACNAEIDESAAGTIADKSIFLEVIIAPSFSPEALEILRAKSVGVRLLASGEPPAGEPHDTPLVEARSISGGLLLQDRDTRLVRTDELQHKAGPSPSREQLAAALFLEPVARSLFSNAVVLGGPSPTRPGVIRMFGAGAGQMDRLNSCRIAVEKAGPLAKGAVCFSDAFFPFADGPKILIDAGVKTLVHPGGSKRDQETFDLCHERGVTCLTTGVRHFRH